MQRRLRTGLAAGALGVALVLAGCASGADDNQQTDPSATEEHQGHGGNNAESGDEEMEHPMDGGPVPEGIAEASEPTYPVGTEVQLTADHMEGMEGVKAIIASSTDETVYMVDYETDGMKMTNHKWVVESEIQPAS